MSEISLRDYFAKLDQLLNASAADEVILNCRHILQFFPKNVAAYRLLGRALIFNGRWEEADSALRRVLSAAPDDFSAHLGLSEVYERQQRGNDAIWHLERAFEQEPNNPELIGGLRALYRRYRQIDPKIQLTGAAVARQYLSNGQYDQAVDALHSTISKMPDRVDLKLTLAQTLWNSGDQVGGAEIALDVLQLLPDCLEANVMLTTLWLNADRPSDAQRYLNRVESLDPYRALEIAQGDAPDDAFRLEALDYQRFSKSEIGAARPDWLSQVGGEVNSPDVSIQAATGADQDWSNWMSGMVASATASNPSIESESNENAFSFEISDFDRDDIPFDNSLFADMPDGAPADSALNGLQDEDPMAWLKSAGVEIHDDASTSSATTFEVDNTFQADNNVPSWMREDDFVISDRRERTAPESDDALAWMRSGSDATPAGSMPNFFSDADDAGIGVESTPLISNPSESGFGWNGDNTALEEAAMFETGDADDSLSGGAFPDFDFLNPAATDHETAQPADAIPDWLNAYSPESDADSPQPEAAAESSAPPDFFAEAPDSKASADALPVSPPALSGGRRGLTGLLQSANLDWLNAAKPAETPSVEDANDEWMRSFGAEPTPRTPVPSNDAPDWLTALDSPNDPLATNVSSSFDAPTFNVESASTDTDDEFDLSDLNAQFESQLDPLSYGTTASDTAPSSSVSPATASSMEFDMPNESDFDWLPRDSSDEDSSNDGFPSQRDTRESFAAPSMSSAETPGDEEEGAIPSWLSALGDVSAEPDADDQPNAAETPSLEDADLSWLRELEADDLAQSQPASAPDPTLDTAFAAQFDNQAFGNELMGEFGAGTESAFASEFDALTGEPGEPDMTAEADSFFANDTPVRPSDIPNWIREMQPDDAAAAFAPAQPTMSGNTDDQPVSGLSDDFLASLQAVGSSDDEFDADGFDALIGETPAANTNEPSGFEPASVDSLDWLTDLQPADFATFPESNEPTMTPDPMNSNEFGWLGEDELNVEVPGSTEGANEQSFGQAIDPSLFDDSLSDDEFAALFDNAPVGEDAFASMGMPASQTPTDDEVVEAAIAAADVPDWLSGLQPMESDDEDVVLVSEDTFDLDAQPLYDGGLPFDVASEMGLEEPGVADYTSPSMNTLEDAAMIPDYDEGAPLYDSDDQDDLVTADAIEAGNAPDWLNAMVPGLDIDFEADEDVQVESEFFEEPDVIAPTMTAPTVSETTRIGSDFGWLVEIADEESAPVQAVAPDSDVTPRRRFAFSRQPAWLNFSRKPAWMTQGNDTASTGNGAPLDDRPTNPATDADFPDWLDDDMDNNAPN